MPPAPDPGRCRPRLPALHCDEDVSVVLAATLRARDLAAREAPPLDSYSGRPPRRPSVGRGYSMSFCFFISDVVSAAIAPTSRGILSGL
jgi:hypothetical protein